MIVDKNHELYASGLIDTGGFFVAKWSGTKWEKFGSSLRTTNWNFFTSIMMLDSAKNIFVLDPYKNAAGKYNVSIWHGSGWQDLGTGANALDANDRIYALASGKSGNVYAFGDFTDSSGSPYVAKWDGKTWKNMGPWPYPARPNYTNTVLYVDDSDNVFAAGYGLTNPAGDYYVAQWKNNSWQEIAAPNSSLKASSPIRSMVKDHRGNLYVSGGFVDANAGYTVAKWDGANWSPVVGTNDPVSIAHGYRITSLTVDASNRLYVASNYASNEYSVAMWNDTAWTDLSFTPNNQGFLGKIYSIATDSNLVYAGGLRLIDNSQVAVYGPLPTPNGIRQISKLNTVVFPNPSKGTFEIVLPQTGNSSGQAVSVSLIDKAGRLVFKNGALPVSGRSVRVQLPASVVNGNYTLTLDIGDKQFAQEVILER